MNDEKVFSETKEIMLPKPKGIIFDLDGTIVDEPEFYSSVYSQSLIDFVREREGEKGVETLLNRVKIDGKGELTLESMGIPYSAWAERLINAPLDLILPQPDIVSLFQNISAKKVIYTGSPLTLAYRLLDRIGFNPKRDFDLIIGWNESETFPLKWTNSSFVFESIAALLNCEPEKLWSVGDDWKADLAPAAKLGMTTVQIRKTDGQSNAQFPAIRDLLSVAQEKGIL